MGVFSKDLYLINSSGFNLIRRLFFLMLAIATSSSLRAYSWSQVDPVFWNPVSFFRVFSAPPFTGYLLFLNILFPALCVLNAFSKNVIISGSTFLTGIFILGYGFNFGKIDHFYHMAVLILAADAIYNIGRMFFAPANVQWENWYLRFVQVSVCAMYCASGITKLLASGPGWFSSDNMKIMLLDHGKELGFWLAHIPFIPKLLAFSALLLELLSPFALFHSALAILFCASWLLMHLSIYLFMGPNFLTHVIAFIFFAPILYPRICTIKANGYQKYSLNKMLFLSLGIYLSISIFEVIYRLDTWPFSSYPMYAENSETAGVTRYHLLGDSSELKFDSFPPFSSAQLERSIRKSVEKNRFEILDKKIFFLNSHFRLGQKSIQIREDKWVKMSEFDPNRPDSSNIVYEWKSKEQN